MHPFPLSAANGDLPSPRNSLMINNLQPGHDQMAPGSNNLGSGGMYLSQPAHQVSAFYPQAPQQFLQQQQQHYFFLQQQQQQQRPSPHTVTGVSLTQLTHQQEQQQRPSPHTTTGVSLTQLTQQQQQQQQEHRPSSHTTTGVTLTQLLSMRAELAQLHQQKQARSASLDISTAPSTSSNGSHPGHTPQRRQPLQSHPGTLTLGAGLPMSSSASQPLAPTHLPPHLLDQATSLDEQLQPRHHVSASMPWLEDGNLADRPSRPSPSAAARLPNSYTLHGNNNSNHISASMPWLENVNLADRPSPSAAARVPNSYTLHSNGCNDGNTAGWPNPHQLHPHANVPLQHNHANVPPSPPHSLHSLGSKGRAALVLSSSFGSRGTGDRPSNGSAWESAAAAAIAAVDGESAAAAAATAAADGVARPCQSNAQNGHPKGADDPREQSSGDLSERSSGGGPSPNGEMPHSAFHFYQQQQQQQVQPPSPRMRPPKFEPEGCCSPYSPTMSLEELRKANMKRSMSRRHTVSDNSDLPSGLGPPPSARILRGSASGGGSSESGRRLGYSISSGQCEALQPVLEGKEDAATVPSSPVLKKSVSRRGAYPEFLEGPPQAMSKGLLPRHSHTSGVAIQPFKIADREGGQLSNGFAAVERIKAKNSMSGSEGRSSFDGEEVGDRERDSASSMRKAALLRSNSITVSGPPPAALARSLTTRMSDSQLGMGPTGLQTGEALRMHKSTGEGVCAAPKKKKSHVALEGLNGLPTGEGVCTQANCTALIGRDGLQARDVVCTWTNSYCLRWPGWVADR
ncbi:hypothetical protein DUNSADRAFT_11101 [Dunaliella salina]|uniref:Uncharacterized protein n=1 Tax=Dunaliella salina TaxID=3046 RepID=A0ABQ7H4K4_DUNSA|nr:hypothetical protein DUNSADRAFT_11101 [Dunaliella salina]|eukprot:KAF5841784.1 hypothetical protein DUNSADRAFT_11101 [Dunaliella salina]